MFVPFRVSKEAIKIQVRFYSARVNTKEKGQTTLTLGEEPNKQVRGYLLETRRRCGIVNTAVAIATGTAIVMSQNTSL